MLNPFPCFLSNIIIIIIINNSTPQLVNKRGSYTTCPNLCSHCKYCTSSVSPHRELSLALVASFRLKHFPQNGLKSYFELKLKGTKGAVQVFWLGIACDV